MKILTLAATLAAGMAIATSAHATEYVVNGDFSLLTNGLGQLGYNTDATGWTTTGYNFVANVADVGSSGVYGPNSYWDAANGGASTWNGQTPNGDNFVAMDGDFGTAPVEQIVNGLTPGQSYKLSFTYAFSQQYGFTGPTNQSIVESFGGQAYTTPTYALPSHGFSGWTTYTTTVTATGTSQVLSFLAQGDVPVPPFALITDVSLTAVPEPATWGMMIVGLGLLGAVARRRRQVPAAA